MPNIGPMEIILVLAVALIVLGPRRLPSAGRALGQGIREFKDSLTGAAQRVVEQDALAGAGESAQEPPR